MRAEFLNAFNRSTPAGINTNVNNALFVQVTNVTGNRGFSWRRGASVDGRLTGIVFEAGG
ncbi:MAG: hypothetical protein JNL62_25100, partial [Bryobacterales bacterium]|nr:hypothetical protein [Bryobacterales bacterium]